MKILIFDDSEMHRRSAETLLKGHDVTIVGTYDEAQALFKSHTDLAKAKQLLVEAGWAKDFQPHDKDVPEERAKAYYQAVDECRQKATTQPHSFDVVLTDLMVPASAQAMGEGMRLAGQEMGLGTTIAFLALSKGVKLVAVVTDTSHHSHPASAAFDCFREKVFAIGDAKVLLDNGNVTTQVDATTFERVSEDFLNSEAGKEKYPVTPRYSREGIVWAKAWDETLAKLLA